MDTPKLLDMVALLEALPEHGLVRGQIGTVVEMLAPDALLVEFSDRNGQTYAMLEVSPFDVVVVRMEPVRMVA